MMLSQEVINRIECAIPHKCEIGKNEFNKCVQCEIDYKFIAIKPRLLKCNHHVCKECVCKVEQGRVKCKICAKKIVLARKNESAAEALVTANINPLFDALKEKYKKALDIYNADLDNGIKEETSLDCTRQKIKNEIDLKVEVLKEELDRRRDELHKQVDVMCDEALKDLINDRKENESFNQIYEKIKKTNRTAKSDFNEYQKSLKKIIEKIHKSCLELHFKDSDVHLDSTDWLGQLQYRVKPKIDKNQLSEVSQVSENLSNKTDQKDEDNNKKHYLASVSNDRTIKIWDLDTFECIKNLKGHNGFISSIQYLGEALIATSSNDRTIKIWDILSESCIHTFTDAHNDTIYALEVLDKDTLISSSEDCSIKIWDLATKTLKYEMKNKTSVLRLKLINDGLLASTDGEYQIKIWDLNKRECIYELIGHTDWVRGLAKCDDNKLVSGSDDGTIRIWDVEKQECIKMIDEVGCQVYSVVLVNPKCLAAGCQDGKIRLFNLTTGFLTSVRRGHTECVWSLKMIEQNILVSGSADKTIRIWNQKGKNQILQGHDSLPRDFALVYME